MLMADISGIRGRVGDSFTPDIVARFASAFATIMEAKNCLVGSDTRRSSEMVKFSAISGLLAAGCGVTDVDVVSTPTAQVATEKLSLDCAVVISASHNPEDWNALKLLGPDGVYLDHAGITELKELFDNPSRIRYVENEKIRDYSTFQGAERLHIDSVISDIDRELIRESSFRVALDASGGAGGRVARDLLEDLGCEVFVIDTSQGVFYFPERRDEHFAQMARAVAGMQLDVGFGLDPDGDRLTVVTDRGEVLLEEKTLALAVAYQLERRKGPVVTNQSTTMAIDEIAAAHDVPVYRSKVGEVYVVQKMREVSAVIGGEGNGGVILPQVHYGRDAMAAMGHLLCYAALRRDSFSTLADELPRTHMHKLSIDIQEIELETVFERLVSCLDGEVDQSGEGLRMTWKDAWMHVRPSRTEPLLRIYAEAKDTQRVEEIMDIAQRAVAPPDEPA